MKPKYVVVTPNYCRLAATLKAAYRIADYAEHAAKQYYGPQAGADCYLVEILGPSHLMFKGLIAGDKLIGRWKGVPNDTIKTFGCANSVVKRAERYLDDLMMRKEAWAD